MLGLIITIIVCSGIVGLTTYIVTMIDMVKFSIDEPTKFKTIQEQFKELWR